jgi:hypothetical protein
MIMLTPTNAAAVVVTLSYVYLLRFIVRLFFGNLSVNAIVFLTHIATLIDSINHITSLCASLIFIFFSVFILSSIFFVFVPIRFFLSTISMSIPTFMFMIMLMIMIMAMFLFTFFLMSLAMLMYFSDFLPIIIILGAIK